MLVKIKDSLVKNYFLILRYFGHRNEVKKQKDKRRIAARKKVCLSKLQKKQIDDFYKKNLGHKIPYIWHELYTSISGNFDYKYVPEYFYINDIQYLLNDRKYYDCLNDKNIVYKIAKSINVKTPESIIECSNNVLISQNKIISLNDCVSILQKCDEIFLKPTRNTNSGVGCILLKKDQLTNITREYIKHSFSMLGSDFIIQKVVHNQHDIAKLNKTSLNTFRITTYFLDGKIYHCPIVLRIGTNNSYLDNAHAGGLFVAVNDNGTIVSNGKNEFGYNLDTHPQSKLQFEGYQIKNIRKIIETAYKLHLQMPHIGIIDWDIALDKDEDPVLIEANVWGGSLWLFQMAHGCSCFGDNTEKVLQLLRNKLY